jgi:hypothetical protein
MLNYSKMAKSTAKISKELESVLFLRKDATIIENATMRSKMNEIPFFKRSVSRPVMGSGGGGGGGFRKIDEIENWRGIKPKSEDGFEEWTGRKNKHSKHHSYGGGGAGAGAGAGAGSHFISHKPSFLGGPKSGLAAHKSDDIAERIMGKIRGKINKLCKDTYDDTKDSISVILDAGETEFISKFIKEVFNCASSQSKVLCELYAKLLHELGESYVQIRSELNDLFVKYIRVFDATAGKEDVGTEDYMKFLEAQKEKQGRKGYSQFIAELVTLGDVEIEQFMNLLYTISKSLQASVNNEEDKLLCEEFAECLKILCVVGCNILKTHSRMPELLTIVRNILALPKGENPGMTNKVRFALMDIDDLNKRGWIPRA